MSDRLPPELDILRIPDGLADVYATVALVSHSAQLHQIPEGTLIATSDWLAWRAARRAARPAILLESLLAEWPAEAGEPTELYLRARDWTLVNGEDATLFHGVSLGSFFDRSVALFDLAALRLWFSLERLIQHFRPGELVFFGLRTEFELVSPPLQLLFLRELCRQNGLKLTELPDPTIDDGNKVEKDVGVAEPEPRSTLRDWVRDRAMSLVSAVFRLRPGAARQAHVLLWTSNGTILPLLDGYVGGTLAPLVLGAALPKRLLLLLRWFAAGVTLTSLPPARLSAADQCRLSEIRANLDGLWQRPGNVLEQVRHQFIRSHIFDNGWFSDLAAEVRQWQQVFRRHKVSRVVVGDITNCRALLIATVAHCQGAAVDEFPNGMFVTGQRSPARTPEHRDQLLARLLAWGPLAEQWCRTQGVKEPIVRVGYPNLEPLRALDRGPLTVPASRTAKVLVLPVYVDCDDSVGLRANILAYLVDMLKALTQAGYRDLRVKIHPGHPNPRYFEAVLREEGIETSLYCDGGLVPHLDWADMVIGPANSGAFAEALAAGRPYYVLLPRPSLIQDELLGSAIVVRSGAELVRRLDEGNVPDKTAILEHLASFSTIPDPCRRFWQVMNGDVSARSGVTCAP